MTPGEAALWQLANRYRHIVEANEATVDSPAAAIVWAAGEVRRLREDLPEVECPACGATIRARLADWPKR